SRHWPRWRKREMRAVRPNCVGSGEARKIAATRVGGYAMGRPKAVAIALFIAALALSRSAVAEDWPARPLTLIVPFAPGGTTDIVARIVGQALSARLGQSVIVENLGGAGGTLGANQAAKAAPDGYTLFMATVAHTMAPGIYKSLPYDFEKDFAPITVI